MLFCNCAIDTRWNLPTPLIIRFHKKNNKILSLILKMGPKQNEKSVAGFMKESKFTLQSFYNIKYHMSPTPIGCFLSTYIRFIFLLLLFLQEELIMRNQMQVQHLLKKRDSENISVASVGALEYFWINKYLCTFIYWLRGYFSRKNLQSEV